jgi:hypothetical protein
MFASALYVVLFTSRRVTVPFVTTGTSPQSEKENYELS